MIRVRRQTVVAVPARNEAERIGACLIALVGQRDPQGRPLFGSELQVLVFVNNSTDATAEAAIAVDPRIRVLRAELLGRRAHAGEARRLAMDAATEMLGGREGVICTTDADSRPRANWISRLWSAFDAGAGAVAGAVEFDPLEAIPAFSHGRKMEAVYSALQAELSARIDPEPYNPWPNHVWAWGANLAVTSSAYRQVGGLPRLALAEDRAFVARLRRHDVPVRHSLEARVWTSARRRGRARGGLADLIADHAGEDTASCDSVLEPAFDVARRALWRRRFRDARASGFPEPNWADRLRLSPRSLGAAIDCDSFGQGWSRIEDASRRLGRRRLNLFELPAEIGRARRMLALLRPRDEADPGDSVRVAAAGLWSGLALS